MNPDRAVGCARAARHETDSGLARQLAVRLGHVRCAAFLTAYNQAQRFARIVKRVERFQIAFARDTIDLLGAVGSERVDQNRAAGSLTYCYRHARCFISLQFSAFVEDGRQYHKWSRLGAKDSRSK